MALQPEWRWCGECEGLFHRHFDNGKCVGGIPHDPTNSGEYGVGFDAPPDQGFEEGWLWCARCQGLFHESNGSCFDGEPHVNNGSRPYWVHLDSVPPGAQGDWRRCNRCARLIYIGFGDGICWDGEPHDVAGSGAYSVDMFEAQSPPPPQPVIRMTERGSLIEISGELFTPGVEVEISFHRGPEHPQRRETVDGEGRFEFVERNARSGSGGGFVMVRDPATTQLATRQLERLFPREPRGPVPIDSGTAVGDD